MSSANFTYQDALDAARKQISDDAGRRVTDPEILAYHLPRVLQQLRTDRPDLWHGLYGSENYKPSATDACHFDDAGFNALVEALVSLLGGEEDEAAAGGNQADAKSQRSRRQ